MSEPERVVDEIFELFREAGSSQYFGEAVSQRQHAEQCAWHACEAGADEELVLAALVHDIGHLLESADALRHDRVGVVNHDQLGERWLLERGFSPRLAGLVGSHVDAKRYLTATNASYWEKLSPASRETLALQGGPMDAASAEQFAQEAGLSDKLRLRRWDEMAKDPDWQGPGIETYREMLVRHLTRLSR